MENNSAIKNYFRFCLLHQSCNSQIRKTNSLKVRYGSCIMAILFVILGKTNKNVTEAQCFYMNTIP